MIKLWTCTSWTSQRDFFATVVAHHKADILWYYSKGFLEWHVSGFAGLAAFSPGLTLADSSVSIVTLVTSTCKRSLQVSALSVLMTRMWTQWTFIDVCDKMMSWMMSLMMSWNHTKLAILLSVRRQNAFEHLLRIYRFFVNQFRYGKRQDTISDKRGIHNTRLTRHNRCG